MKENKDKVINDLLKRISNLEFDVEDKDRRINRAIEYINTFWEKSEIAVYDKKYGTYLEEPNAINKLLNILKGSDKE